MCFLCGGFRGGATFAFLGFACGDKVRSSVLGEFPRNGEWVRAETTLPAEGETMPAYLDSGHHRHHHRAQERTFRAGEAGPRSTQGKQSCRGQRWPCQRVLPRASASQALGPQQPHTLGPGHQSASFAMSHKSHLHESLQRRKLEYYHGSLTIIVTAPYLSINDVLRAFALYLTKIV